MMSPSNEKVDKDAWRGDKTRDHIDLPVEITSSSYNELQNLQEIAAAAAEEAIQRVLAPSQEVDANAATCETGQDVPNQRHSAEHSGQSFINTPSQARKKEESHVPTFHVSTLMSQVPTSKQSDVSSDDHASATCTMASSILSDKAIYNDIYDLATNNLVLWDAVCPELAELRAACSEQNGETLAMFSKAYAHVEITFSSETSSLVQIVPTPIQFRITSLDRSVPRKFEDFIFAQEMSDDGYVRKYGISASIYSADISSGDRTGRLYEFKSHLQRIHRCLVKVQTHIEDANKWNDYVGATILEWVSQFSMSSTSLNFFIRQNIKQGDIRALERILDDKKPAVVDRAVMLKKLK
jgi:hypothetical protein